jgi:S1-C subfamily serine protease
MRAVVLLTVALAACAQAQVQAPEVRRAPEDSVVPGTIGVMVRQEGASVVVSGARVGSAVWVGDVVLRYNGEAVGSPRQFYRLMVDSTPGSVARLDVMRGGTVHTLEVPVRELDTMPRA